MATKEQTRRVKSAEKAFEKADKALADFEDKHPEFFGEFDRLAANRETARLRLLAAVSDAGIPAAGMRVTRPVKRTFDGRYLYENLEPDVRDEVVELVYKVDKKAYDKAKKAGLIAEDMDDWAITSSETSISVTRQVKPIRLR